MAVRWHGHMTFPWFSFGSPDRGLSNAFWIMWFEQELKEIQLGEYHYSQQALPSIKLLWCSGNSTSACLLVLGSIPGKADFGDLLLLCQFEIVGADPVDPTWIDRIVPSNLKLARSDRITKHYLLDSNTTKKWLYLCEFLSKSHGSYVVGIVSSRATRVPSHQVTWSCDHVTFHPMTVIHYYLLCYKLKCYSVAT